MNAALECNICSNTADAKHDSLAVVPSEWPNCDHNVCSQCLLIEDGAFLCPLCHPRLNRRAVVSNRRSVFRVQSVTFEEEEEEEEEYACRLDSTNYARSQFTSMISSDNITGYDLIAAQSMRNEAESDMLFERQMLAMDVSRLRRQAEEIERKNCETRARAAADELLQLKTETREANRTLNKLKKENRLLRFRNDQLNIHREKLLYDIQKMSSMFKCKRCNVLKSNRSRFTTTMDLID